MKKVIFSTLAMLLLALPLAIETRTETLKARASFVSANFVDVEGVEFNGPTARLKTGYQFQLESSKSVAVLKTSNVARIQTGTLTCTRPGRGGCGVKFYGERATCSSGCSFVGYRGVVKAR